MTSSNSNRMQRLIPVVLLALAAAVRWYGLNGQPLSVDECMELEIASRSIREIITASNSFPPLYHLLLKIWMLIDHGQTAARHFSFAIGMLTLLAFWRLMIEAADRRTALVAFAFAAISPFHVYYSQEGRAYGLFLLLAVLAMQFGLRLMRAERFEEDGSKTTKETPDRSRMNRLAFVVIGVAGAFTHYYFVAVLVAIVIGALLVNGTAAARTFLPLAIAIALLASPLFALLPDDLQNQRSLSAAHPCGLTAVGYAFFSYESGYSLGPSLSHWKTMSDSDATNAVATWLVPVGSVVVCLLLLGSLYFPHQRELRYWICLLVVPFAIIGLLSYLLGVTFNPRFVISCWVPYGLLVAMGFQSLLPKPRLVVGAGLLAIYALALFNRQHNAEYQNQSAQPQPNSLQCEPECEDSPDLERVPEDGDADRLEA